MPRVFIGLGSNIGNTEMTIKEALCNIDNHPEISVVAVSSLYQTEPVGYENQPWFSNCVAEVETLLNPDRLLDVLQDIENDFGRIRTIRWGPRTLDIDILLYDKLTIFSEKLIVPHPRMKERSFVMVPLVEIAASAEFPDGKTAADVQAELDSDKKYSCIMKKIW
ncbi:MAG TPA: 2-amino-4-hydroxy-6-hydroxymethyldihydropteridine diphosphokinase [Desulfobacteria bacterium]|nr:2-amino-4-hydroxy-6-hydroxymethyldihydropteridine diphosphokinase [Desulfobacteria bacterium]